MNAAPELAEVAISEAKQALSAAVLGQLARVFGRSGVEHSGGKVVQPWNRFGWREWAAQADLMTLDPQVMLAWGVVQAAVLSAGIEVRAGAPGDPMSERLAVAVREVFGLEGAPGLMSRSLDDMLADVSWFIYYGAIAMEVVWTYDARTGWDIPTDLAPRIPSSIDKWGEGDQLGPITQIVRGGGVTPEPIPGRKFLLFTLGRLGTDYTGRGKARAAWSAWKRRLDLQDARQVGCSRLGVLPPVIETSLEAVVSLEQSGALPLGTFTTMVSTLQADLRRLQAGGDAVLCTVAGVTDVKWGTADNFDPTKMLAAEESEATEIHAAFGTLFLRMGINGEGSRALSQSHLEILRAASVGFAKLIASTINGPWRAGGGLIGAFVKLNFGDIDPRLLPRLVFTGLEPNALAEALGLLPGLATAGGITMDDGIERAVRQVLDLPPLATEDERTPTERATPAAPPAPAPAAAFVRAYARAQAAAREVSR
jgi:hypothetical protein